MEFQFAFKQMETSEALQDYAEKKIREKIAKFVTKPIEARITFSVRKREHVAHCSLVGGDGFNLEVQHTCEDMYASVDRLIDKLESQLKKHKEKLKEHKFSKEKLRHLTQDEVYLRADVEAVDASDVIESENARRKTVV